MRDSGQQWELESTPSESHVTAPISYSTNVRTRALGDSQGERVPITRWCLPCFSSFYVCLKEEMTTQDAKERKEATEIK